MKIDWKSTVVSYKGRAFRVWGENKESGAVIYAMISVDGLPLPSEDMVFDNLSDLVFEEGPPFEVTFEEVG